MEILGEKGDASLISRFGKFGDRSNHFLKLIGKHKFLSFVSLIGLATLIGYASLIYKFVEVLSNM